MAIFEWKDIAVFSMYLWFLVPYAVLLKMRLLTKTPRYKHAVVAAICICSWILYKLEFSYEGLLLIECVAPAYLGWDYIKVYFRVRPLLFCFVIPLLFATTVLQNKSAGWGEWGYDFAHGGRYLLGIIDGGIEGGYQTDASHFLWLGSKMAVAELICYPMLMFKILAEWSVLAFILPDDIWEKPSRGIRGHIAPIVNGLMLSGLLVSIILFFGIKGRLPADGLLSSVGYVLFFVGYAVSKEVRAVSRTRIYRLIMLYPVFFFLNWEWVHSSILRHWIYNWERGLGCITPFFQKFHFPTIPLFEAVPSYYSFQTVLAYPVVYQSMIVGLLALYAAFPNDLLRIERIMPGRARLRERTSCSCVSAEKSFESMSVADISRN